MNCETFKLILEWHVISGLVATFIEAPLQMQQFIRYPEAMTQMCQRQNIPVVGNAANHTEETGGLLDLTGEPSAPPPLPAGFTAKGYGAMAGCCIAAVMGLLTIIWYGITDSPDSRTESSQSRTGNSETAEEIDHDS
jgi:iron transport multicopper oxidase